jgi:hypothetical protein
MNLFVSYAFNEENRWIEELAIPLIKSLGFFVVTGRRLEGDIIAEGVDARMRECRGCVGFTTRRTPRPEGDFFTHQWVLDELSIARALKLNVVEVREENVHVEGMNDSFAQLRYARAARDLLLVQLADVLARWPVRRVQIQLLPPNGGAREFTTHILRGEAQCAYRVQSNGRTIASGLAPIEPIRGGFFAEIEVPREEVLVQLEIRKASNGSWKSFGDGVKAVPIQLFDA